MKSNTEENDKTEATNYRVLPPYFGKRLLHDLILTSI